MNASNLRKSLLHWKRSLKQQLVEMDGEAASGLSGEEFADPVDASLRRADAMLDGILREVASCYPGRPLVAYGSRVSGLADTHSDVDILVIEYDRNAKPIQVKMEVQGVDLDVTRVGFRRRPTSRKLSAIN